jgi:hypothetical protein
MSNQLRTIKKREGGLLHTDRPKTNTPTTKYQTPSVQSSPNLKEFLGVLLLRLTAGYSRPDDLQQFDRLLRKLYAGGAI